MNDQLNREEREILEKCNRGELHPVTDVGGEMTTARQAARNTQRRDDDAEAMSDVARSAGLKVPNAETRRAMAECEEMMRRGTARFANAEEMFAELERHGSAVVAVPREGRSVLTAAEVEERSADLRSGARSASGTQGVE